MESKFYVYTGPSVYGLGAPIVIVALEMVADAHAILAEWFLCVVSRDNRVTALIFGRTPLQLNKSEIEMGVRIDEKLAQEGALAKAEARFRSLQEDE